MNLENQPDDPDAEYVFSNIGESIKDDEDIDGFENAALSNKSKGTEDEHIND